MSCLFCSIAEGTIPSKKAYEDDQCLVFYDIAPQAPVHLLVIPKEHIESVGAVTQENAPVIAHMMTVIAKLAQELKLVSGFRVVSNCGKDAQQSVPHLHFHLLAGRELGWPPG
ncbi:MAG: histidine triad nucleotide-binding protein [Oscillospiraceae bacterium]